MSESVPVFPMREQETDRVLSADQLLDATFLVISAREIETKFGEAAFIRVWAAFDEGAGIYGIIASKNSPVYQQTKEALLSYRGPFWTSITSVEGKSGYVYYTYSNPASKLVELYQRTHALELKELVKTIHTFWQPRQVRAVSSPSLSPEDYDEIPF